MIIAIAVAVSIILSAVGTLAVRLAVAYSIRKNANRKGKR